MLAVDVVAAQQDQIGVEGVHASTSRPTRSCEKNQVRWMSVSRTMRVPSNAGGTSGLVKVYSLISRRYVSLYE